MLKRKYKHLDKSSWPRGPWDTEPDKMQWRDKATGLPCLMVRGPMGALCGYVGVSPGHPCYGKHYDDCHDAHENISVHYGLTFAGKCQNGPEDMAICHRVEPGESDDVWWLGFDCAHSYDFAPGTGFIPRLYRQTYRDVSYVKAQCKQLAQQLASIL